MWALRIPHRSEPGFSTPIPEGQPVDPRSDNVSLSIYGLDVEIAPDATNRRLNTGAETRIRLGWQTPGYHTR